MVHLDSTVQHLQPKVVCLAGVNVNRQVVDFVTAKLKDILGLTLFGYDVIVEEHSGKPGLCINEEEGSSCWVCSGVT